MAVDDDQPGITAYHGSPHKFDKFDSSKIGTGEGAQAYGHGMYFAEHEPVAKSYKDNLTGKSTEVEFPNGDTDDFGKPLRWHPDSLDDKTEAAAARAVLSYSGSLGQKQVIRQHLDNSKDAANAMRLIKNKEIYPAAPGYMYKVAINAHPDHFLDWDKPLSEQHPSVKEKIKTNPGFVKEAERIMEKPIEEMSGKVIQRIALGYNADREGVAMAGQGQLKMFQEMNIPGIKYLDGNSRGQGEGTKNYVVFDPKIVEIKNRYAEGGFIHDPEKAKRRALTVARGVHKADGGEAEVKSKNTKTWALPGQPTRTFNDPQTGNKHTFAITDPNKDVTSKNLATEVTSALSRHLSLPYAQQVANSKAAIDKLAPYVGKDSAGDIKPFLTMNAKLEKASAGYEGGKGYEGASPLQLEGGVGVKTIGLPLSPAYQHGKYKVCANAASCKENCLGQHSGNYSNPDWWPQQNSVNKTHAFLSEPGALAVQLHNEIKREKLAAEMQGNRLAVRMNVLSDTDPRVWESLIKAHPDVDFYDYTKMNYDPIASNHHYTYSSTGVSQPANVSGLSKDVHNPHQNWKQMRQRLDTGSNVAMVFTHNDHLPHEVHDQETGKKYRVIDGTTHDYRPLDKQPEGEEGVIVGLRNLDHRLGRDVAAEKSNGFMVHYDPKIQMVPNKRTGEPTKTAMKDENGATIPTNRAVVIAPQGDRRVPHNLREGRARGGQVGSRMPPEYAIQQFHNFNKFDEPNKGPATKSEKHVYSGPVEGDVSDALALTRRYVKN